VNEGKAAELDMLVKDDRLVNEAVAQLVEALCHKPKSSGFDSQWGSLRFFIHSILSVALWPWGRLSL
jgi:hypothetical protein